MVTGVPALRCPIKLPARPAGALDRIGLATTWVRMREPAAAKSGAGYSLSVGAVCRVQGRVSHQVQGQGPTSHLAD